MQYRTVQSLRDYNTTQGEENAKTKIICRISKLKIKKKRITCIPHFGAL